MRYRTDCKLVGCVNVISSYWLNSSPELK